MPVNERIDQKGTPTAEWGRPLAISDIVLMADPNAGATLGRMVKVPQSDMLLNASNLVTGTIPAARYGVGTIPINRLVFPGGTTDFLRADGSFATPPAGGFDDPMTDIGDTIIRNALNVTTRLAAGSEGQVYKIVGGVPAWATDETGGGGGGGITALTSDVTASGSGSVVATIAANAVSNAKFRQSAGLSVVGNSTNSTANVADITAGTDNHVLRRSGSAIGFGLLVNDNLTNNTIQFAKIQTIAANRLLGSEAGGNISEITIGSGLAWSGGALISTGGGGYTLPEATKDVLGGVKISSGLDVDGDGAVIVDTVRPVTAVETEVAHLRNDAQSIARRDDGTLYMAYSQFGSVGSGDFDEANIAAVVSTDAGKSWGAPTMIISRGSDQSVFIPSLYVQANGDMIMIFLKLLTSLTETELWWAKLPSGSSTWGTPVKIYGIAAEYYSPGSHQIVKLRNGDLIYSFCKNTSPGDLGSQTGTYVGKFMRSTDDGDTWAVEAVEIESPDDLCVESGIVQFDDDSIMCYWRARSTYVGYAISTDDMTTFEDPQWLGLKAPNSTPFLVYEEKQKALIAVTNVYNPVAPSTPIEREILQLSVSYDRGQSFRQVYRLDKETDFFFFEPIIFLNNNQWIVAYAKMDSGTSTESNIETKLVPNWFTGDGDKEFISTAIFNKVFDGVASPNFIEFYARGVSTTNAYITLGNQSAGLGTFSPWLRWKNNGSSFGFLVTGNIGSGTTGWQFDFNNAAADVSAGNILLKITNNGTRRHEFYAEGDFLQAAGTYHNFGLTHGGSGYGFRDATGEMQYKDDGGTWISFNTLGGGGGTIDGSGTAGKITKWTDSNTLTSSLASDDGTYFYIPIAIIGNPAAAESGWDAHFEHVGGSTAVLFQNKDNNTNTNLFRCVKKRGASFTLVADDQVFKIDAQGGVGELTLIANTETPADNITNLDFVWKGRQDENFGERLRSTGSGILYVKKKADGGNADILVLSVSDVGSYITKFANQTSGGGGSNPWWYTKSQSNSSPGIWQNDVTATGDGWIFNTLANSGAMSASNYLWDFQNNGSSKFKIFADGDTVLAGTLTTAAGFAWDFGAYTTGSTGITIDSTKYVTIFHNGTTVNLAVVVLP